MKTNYSLNLRVFPIRLHDHSTGTEREDLIVLDKSNLQAAQLVGQSSKELIERICDRQSCTVLWIGKPRRMKASLDLEELYGAFNHCQPGKREAVSG